MVLWSLSCSSGSPAVGACARARRRGVRADRADAARTRCVTGWDARKRLSKPTSVSSRRRAPLPRRSWRSRATSRTRSSPSSTFGVLGRLELALGNLQAAAEHLRDLPGRLLAGGINDPAVPVWADAIETLVALGEIERARAYLEPYEAHAERLGSPLRTSRRRPLPRAAPAPQRAIFAGCAVGIRAFAGRRSGRSRSSGAVRCSVWAWCAGRRRRSARPARRSSRRSRSSRSWARGLGGEGAGGAAADQRSRAARPMS